MSAPRSPHDPWLRPWAVVAVLAMAVGACLMPADASDEVVVEFDQSSLSLSIGDSAQITATVSVQGAPLPDAIVVYGTSDAGVVLVTPTGQVRAVGPGAAEVTATVVGFADATPAAAGVRVSRAIRITNVLTELGGENTAAWGELLSIVGISLDPEEAVVFVGPEAARVAGYVRGDTADPAARDTLRVWTPALVPEQSPIVVARLTGTGAGAQWPMRVLQYDVMEPNEAVPSTLVVVSTPVIRPDLVLEVPETPGIGPANCASVWGAAQGECWFDWYRFQRPFTPSADSVTIVFKFAEAVENLPVSIEVSEATDDPEGWTVGRNFSLCLDDRGSEFIFYPTPHEFAALRDSFMVALAGVSGRTISFSATLFGVDKSPEVPWPGRPTGSVPYELRVLPSYVSERPPDLAEENDYCHGAYELSGSDTLDLTFDNGTDLDWFRIVVPEAPPAATQADVAETEPNNTPGTADTVQYGDRATGVIGVPGDADFFAFFADSGATLDIEVVASRNGSTLRSLLFLYNDDGVVAWNDDFLAQEYDSRVTVAAPKTGWYWASVTDERLRGGDDYFYTLAVSTAGGSAAFLTVEACCGSGAGEFDPQIQLWEDVLLRDGGIAPLETRPGLLEVPVLPGAYFVLVYNQAGDAVDYQLRVRLTQGGGAAPPPAVAQPRRPPPANLRLPWRRGTGAATAPPPPASPARR